ncbi:MAG: NUDIX hydrolase [Chloroflexi bacterium]|nr:NUDIX hydrolase [Chloroflexota bacterium]
MVTEVSAGGVLLDDGDIFLLHKPNGEWVMPKGHLESGETPEQAAVREVLEETGLTARIVAKVGETRYQFRVQPSGQVKRKRVHWFLMKVDNRKLDVEPTFEEGVFLPVEDALKTLTFENDKDIARKAVEWHRRHAPTNRAPARRDADHTPS